MRAFSKRAGLAQDRTRLIWIISITVGATVVATTMLVVFHLMRHRRQRQNKHFRQACLRDPGLTREEYERKGRLTRSRLLFEEEIQRSDMIRKSQQSRTSDRKHGSAVSSEQELVLPQRLQRSPSRSQSWHGRSRSTAPARPLAAPAGGKDYSDPVPDVERGDGDFGHGGVAPAREGQVLADWNSVHASVERTWQLLHGRNRPAPPRTAATPGSGQSRRDDDDNNTPQDQDAPPRPPSVRLKTPPLLSHPIFRDGNAAHRSKHMSLPTELTRVKTEPRGNSNTRIEQGDGPGHKEEDIRP